MELSVAQLVLAGKQREIEELRHLAIKARLAGVIGHLVHALQNERGASSIFLASGGQRFEGTRAALITESSTVETYLRKSFAQQLEMPAFGNARLYSVMAWVLLGLDALAELRRHISQREVSATEAVNSFSALIAGLISLIFEVADAAVDPAISRALVALFHFIQGKELAGQERAVGSLSFASGRCDPEHQQRILHLIDAQERSFQVFAEYADAPRQKAWQQAQGASVMARIERYRRILVSARPGTELDANLSDRWFDDCSERLATMWEIQCSLVDLLHEHCNTLIESAERELLDAEGLLQRVRQSPPPRVGIEGRFFEPGLPDAAGSGLLAPEGEGPRLGQSIIDVLQAQSQRLAAMEVELDSARRALNERKTIERAKGLLMARLDLSEDAAYKLLRQTSMEQNRRLVDVAEATLTSPIFVLGQKPAHQK